MTLPRRLAAPPATWERDVDVVVLGSGAAGLSAALAVRPVRSVLVVTKDILSAGSTQWAQGGLAGVLDPSDTIEDHVRDTLDAGAGLCDEAVVRELVTEAPRSIRYLMRLGAAFDPDQGGTDIALTREGGHSHNRIVHSGGDRSGAEVQRTLDESAIGAGVEVMGHAFALDLVMGTAADGEPQVVGVRIGKTDEQGIVVSIGVVTARAVVIASGGYGQVFASTSNPPAVTGDGLAMALRAGLPVTDVEFVQFHPTVMWRGPDALGQQALVSEAVRGEGAILYDAAGERVMAGVHPLEDLAPRDVVAAAISRRMAEAPGGVDDHVYLDATHLGERFHARFPSITEACREIGLDPAVDRIPVAPAAHYACGGIRAGLDGRTALRGLYAVGEVSATGVHGANRLASNSLTESIVSGTWVGRDLAWEVPDRVPIDVEVDDPLDHRLLDPARLREVRAVMSRHVGVVRDELSLASASGALGSIARTMRTAAPSPDDAAGDGPSRPAPSRRTWEATNILTVATAMVAAASHAHREPRLPPPIRPPDDPTRVGASPRRHPRPRRRHQRGGPTMTTLTCDDCGFDGSRWSSDDLERTLAHADDLIGYVLEGATDAVVERATAEPVGVDDDPVVATHAVMHRLHELAAARRGAEVFEPMTGRIESLQASGGGAPKLAIPSAEIGPSGVSGDVQGNRRNHGRPWQALCLYSSDLIEALRAEGHPIVAGGTGENLTISGVDWSRMRGGLTITIGDVVLRTSGPAAPCHKIGDCFTERHWDRIDHVARPGWARWYASVLSGGTVAPGDIVTISA